VKRNRALYAAALGIVIVVGLASRRYPQVFPKFIAEYAGDTLWALTVYLAIGFVSPSMPPIRAAFLALCIAFVVEFSQLYQATWIEALRKTMVGKLTLGSGFLWSDLVCYCFGIGAGALVEGVVLKRRSRVGL
jgi:hypothetical protein